MDSVFRSAKEKLEREHKERKESGKRKLEREKKAKDAAERQREAIEASQRARRLESIEAQMKVEDNLGGDSSLKLKLMRQESNIVEGGSDKQSKLREECLKYYEDVKWDNDDDEDVTKARGGEHSPKVRYLWLITQGMKMRQEAKVDGGSFKNSKVQDDYRKAYYALLNQPGVAGAEQGEASGAANKIDLNAWK